MKLANPFASKHSDQAEADLELLETIEEETAKTEAEKEAKRAAREQRRLERERAKKREQREKLVAPILLLLTVLISAALWLLS